jgi:hypothetical protein
MTLDPSSSYQLQIISEADKSISRLKIQETPGQGWLQLHENDQEGSCGELD